MTRNTVPMLALVGLSLGCGQILGSSEESFPAQSCSDGLDLRLERPVTEPFPFSAESLGVPDSLCDDGLPSDASDPRVFCEPENTLVAIRGLESQPAAEIIASVDSQLRTFSFVASREEVSPTYGNTCVIHEYAERSTN